MDKAAITDTLEEIAVLLELKGENPFKARAYTNAARALDNFEGDIATLVAENRLGELAGIGDALQLKITELVKTGKLEYYEKLRATVPAGLLAMMEIPALGPKKIKVLHEKLGITTVEDLEKACKEHKVRDLAGFRREDRGEAFGQHRAGPATTRPFFFMPRHGRRRRTIARPCAITKRSFSSASREVFAAVARKS